MGLKDITNYLVRRLPQFGEIMTELLQGENFAGMLQLLVNFQHQLLRKHCIAKTSQVIRWVAHIYHHAENNTQFLIVHLYLRAVGNFKERCAEKEWNYIRMTTSSNFLKLIPQS